MNALICTVMLGACGLVAASAEPPTANSSPRLTRLARELESGNHEALTSFWKEMNGKTPLLESADGAQPLRRATFVWRSTNDTKRVTMIGGLPGANLLKPMTRLSGTDLWFLTEVHSTEARFQYAFQVNGPEEVRMEAEAIGTEMQRNAPRPDPLNPRVYEGWSYVELSDAPPQPWIRKDPAVPTGRKLKEKLKSQILDAEYTLGVYLPPSYEREGPRSWLMIAFDGGFKSMDVSLDNLLAAGKIPPLVVVGVENINSRTRMLDLNCSDEFLAFLVKEVVPWARKTYRVYDDPGHTLVGGMSLGGKMAVYCGLKHSEVFGKVLSQSGSFLTGARQRSPTALWNGEAPGLLAAQFLESPRVAAHFYIEAGRYETTLPFSPLLETRRLRDVLQAKGYRVTYSEFVGGHNEICWRGSFANAVMALTGERP